jgi:hypothetical protein
MVNSTNLQKNTASESDSNTTIFDSSSFSSTSVDIINVGNNLIHNNINNGTGSTTSTTTGDNMKNSITSSSDYSNLITNNLSKKLLDNFIEKIENNDIITSLTTTFTYDLISTKNNNLAIEDNEIPGLTYNVNTFYKVFSKFLNNSNAHGANSTVNYFATFFQGITSNRLTDFLPIMNFGPNDYILYDITVPDLKWLSQHNLFNITPYFYTYVTPDNRTTTPFASVDVTIPLFNEFKTPGKKIKICMTSSKNVAEKFESKGYIISKIPVDYINSTTFLPLIRVGNLHNVDAIDINRFCKTHFYKSSDSTINNNFTSQEIINQLPPTLSPNNPTFLNNLNTFTNIVTYLNNNVCDISKTLQTYKYLSNFYEFGSTTPYAIDSFYTSISTTPIAGIQGNNTGENYFNSNAIDLRLVKTQFLYILSLNQNKMQIGLSSNIQVYDLDNLKVITNGTISTSPELPSMASSLYPEIDSNYNNLSLFNLSSFNVQNLLNVGIKNVIIIERNTYNPINYYQSSNDYAGKCYILYGKDLSTDDTANLKTITNNDITISYLNN